MGQFWRDERAKAKAFREGVEEGFVRAAELSGDPETILRQFRPISYSPVVLKKRGERMNKQARLESEPARLSKAASTNR